MVNSVPIPGIKCSSSSLSSMIDRSSSSLVLVATKDKYALNMVISVFTNAFTVWVYVIGNYYKIILKYFNGSVEKQQI